MLELAGALLIGLLTFQTIKFLLARGLVLGSRREEPKNDVKRRPLHARFARREEEPERPQQAEYQREAERWRHRQREWAAKQSEEAEWWRVLEVSPDASEDEIRRSYLVKIKQSHPDRVVWLAPELLPSAESRSKLLNAAYVEAIRARRAK
jgi:DnaJ-domain-containing protein 1